MRKRYLCFFTIFFAASLAIITGEWFDTVPIFIWIAGACLGAVVIATVLRRARMALCCLLGFLAGILVYHAYTDYLVKPLYDLDGTTQVIYAEVCDYPDLYEDSQRVEVKVDAKASNISYPKRTFSSLIYLPHTEEVLKPGDEIQVTASFYIPSYSDGFDRKSYQAAQGRFIQASSTKEIDDFVFHVSACEKIPLRYYPGKFAETWKTDLLDQFDPQTGGFLTSLLLGDRSALSDHDYINLKKSGLSHIIAVSGMHLMILVAFATRIFGKKFGTILSIPIVLLFACMAGNTPSVMRAAIMVIAAAIAFLAMDEFDALTVLAFSLLLLLLYNPYSIASVSLQLSYLSTLGLMLYADRVETFFMYPFRELPAPLRKIISYVTTAVSCSLCATLFTTPVLVYTYGYVTLISPISNLLTIGLISICFLGGLLFCLFPFLGKALVPCVTGCVKYILAVADQCADLWPLILDWKGIYAKSAVIIVCLIIIVILLGKRTRPKFTLPVLCAILILCIYQNAKIVETSLTTTIHAVGNGQMITVASGRESVILIDCGSGSNRNAVEILNEYMIWNDFKEIDQIILTAVDKTHARAFLDVIECFPVRKVILPSGLQENEFTQSVLQELRERQIPYTQWETEGENDFNLEGYDISLIGGTDRKLGVRLLTDSGDLLVLHSFTQKMLDQLLQKQILTADQLVLSASNIEDVNLLKQALNDIEPEVIIFPAGGDYVASKLYDIPTRNTYLEGDIKFYSTRKME